MIKSIFIIINRLSPCNSYTLRESHSNGYIFVQFCTIYIFMLLTLFHISPPTNIWKRQMEWEKYNKNTKKYQKFGTAQRNCVLILINKYHPKTSRYWEPINFFHPKFGWKETWQPYLIKYNPIFIGDAVWVTLVSYTPILFGNSPDEPYIEGRNRFYCVYMEEIRTGLTQSVITDKRTDRVWYTWQ
jgi:hypothetical protein